MIAKTEDAFTEPRNGQQRPHPAPPPASVPIKELLASRQAHAKAKLDFYPKAEAKRPTAETTLKDLIDAIRSDEYAQPVAAIREALARQEDAAALKKALPAVSLSGSITGQRKAAMEEGRFIHSGLLQIDLDGKDNPAWTVDTMREFLRNDPHIVAGFISASGKGVKGVLRISADPHLHKQSFHAAEAYFAKAGLKIDPACKDPIRLCFVSYDPDAWIRETLAAELAPLPELENPPPAAKDPAAVSSRGIKIRGGCLPASVDDIRAALACIPRGQKHEDWIRISSAVWDQLGEAGTMLLREWDPEDGKGQSYDYKFKHRLKDVHIGTLIFYARQHGYRPPTRFRAAAYGIDEFQAEQIEEIIENGKALAMLRDDSRGFAEAFAALKFGQWAYVHDELGWRFYRDGIWERDHTGQIFDEIQRHLTPLFLEAAAQAWDSWKVAEMDEKQAKQAAKEFQQLRQLAGKINNLTFTKKVAENAGILEAFRSRRADFDTHPDLIVIENGTFDSSTGTLRDHDPADMATVRTRFRYDAAATCPRFDQFMQEVMCGDAGLVDYLWRFVAYAATGRVNADVVPFFYGEGSNGKSTFFAVLRHLFADYARTLDVEALLSDRPGNSDDYKKAALEGVRLAVADELPSGRRLNTAMLKRLVGGDSITARNPYERQREFRPTHKMVLCGNHKPEVRDTDTGTWRRIHLIPWKASFRGDKARDRDEVVRELIAEAPGIFNRLTAAMVAFKERGLSPPEAVADATREYQTAQDQVRQFSDECLRKVKGEIRQLAGVLDAYRDWCRENGEEPTVTTGKKMGIELGRLGWTTVKGAKNKVMVEDLFIIDPD